jgi:uncharacterized Zn finger protein
LKGGWELAMKCLDCGPADVTERRDLMADGYRRSRCLACGQVFNERWSGS